MRFKEKHNFKELLVWKLAMDVVEEIYTITDDYPKEESFGLTAQTRKSAISIPSNTAEGCGRGTNPQFVQFLSIAQGSAYELETQLYIALRRKYGERSRIENVISKIHEVQKMLYSLIQKHS